MVSQLVGIMRTLNIGSSRFFSGMDGFELKDIDKLCIMDTFRIPEARVLHFKKIEIIDELPE